jgi:outer membrane protein TolC
MGMIHSSVKNHIRKAPLGAIFAIFIFSSLKAHGQQLPPSIDLKDLFKASLQSSEVKKLSNKQFSAKASIADAANSLTPQFTLEAQKLDSEKDPTNSFSPSHIEQNSVTAGLKKYFSSGTELALNLSKADSKLTYESNPAASLTEYSTVSTGVSLKQNLYKDFLGLGTRHALKSSKFAAEATAHEVNEQILKVLMNTKDLFFQFKFLKLEASIALKRIKEQQNFLEVMKIKRKRGTAEKSDLLQAESALYSAEVRASETRERASAIWKSTINFLKLPNHWKNANFDKLTLSSQGISSKAQTICRDQSAEVIKHSETYLKTSNNLEASRRAFLSSKYFDRSDLYFKASYTGNGLDEESSEASSESTKFEKPDLLLSVGTSIPLGHTPSFGQFLRSKERKLSAKISLDAIYDELKTDLENHCHKLNSLKSNQARLEKKNNLGLEIERLEKKRYELGKVDISQYINSTNQRDQFELEYQKNSFDISSMEWEIIALTSSMDSFQKNFL